MTEHGKEVRAKRSRQRRARMEGNKASTWDEAERWDLQFWQRRTPQERLSAVVAIQRDLEAIHPARGEPLDTDESR